MVLNGALICAAMWPLLHLMFTGWLFERAAIRRRAASQAAAVRRTPAPVIAEVWRRGSAPPRRGGV